MNAETMLRLNHRQMRAQRVAAAIMNEFDRRAVAEDRHDRRRLYEALIDVLESEGVEIFTDHDRAVAGLPARGPDGWTLEEIAAFDCRMLDALLKPVTMIVPLVDPPDER